MVALGRANARDVVHGDRLCRLSIQVRSHPWTLGADRAADRRTTVNAARVGDLIANHTVSRRYWSRLANAKYLGRQHYSQRSWDASGTSSRTASCTMTLSHSLRSRP